MHDAKTDTVASLRALLGLRDPLDHTLESRWEMANMKFRYGNLSDQEVLTRRGGKTTEMVLRALAHVAETGERVVLVAHSLDMARCVQDRARDYAERLGIDPRRITASWGRNSNATRGLRSSQVFTDHVILDGI